MSKVVTTTVAPTQPGDTVTLGGTGDSVVITNNDIRTNVLQDAGGNAIFTSDGSGTLSGLNSGLSGDGWKLLNTSTASGASSVEFTSLTGYKIFKFVFIDVAPSADNRDLVFNGSTDDGSTWATKTTSYFETYHGVDGASTTLTYGAAYDLAQSTSDQILARDAGGGADECIAGEIVIFNPASTTYVKHFYSTIQYHHYYGNNQSQNNFVAGYFNTTSALNRIKFLMDADNLSGTIKQYGLVAL